MIYSTDEIWRGSEEDRCLTDDLNAIESDIADLEAGKAPANHTHSGYAPADHEHTDYADAEHTHSGYAENTHTHEQSSISGLIAALAAKADETHDHTLAQVVGLVAALAAKADLVDGKVPASQLPSYVDDVVDGILVNETTFKVNGVAVTPEADKIYNDTDENKSYRWSGSQFVSLNEGVALGETSATAYRGDRGKIAYDHSQNGNVHVTAAQKTTWDGKAAGDHNHDALYAALSHIHPTNPVTTANEDLNNYTIAGVYSFAASYQPVNRPEGTSNGWLVVIPWNANPATGTIKQFWLRHGTLGANDHCIYVRTKIGDSGWSSWATIYTSKNPPTAAEVGAAPADHNHATAYIAKALQFTADNGGMEKTFYTSDNTNLITELEALGMGVHTVYSQAGVSGNPNATESWRFLLHKASSNIIWVLAFGTSGSIYSNYLNGSSGWRGWRCLFSASPSALWTGSLYMNASQTVTPSKKLSECRNGWILMWSDYDADSGTANINDVVTSVIFKKSIGGTNWGGAAHYFDVPSYMGADGATDTSGEKRVIKRLYVHDDKLVGHNNNNIGERKDVVLRAVYEF